MVTTSHSDAIRSDAINLNQKFSQFFDYWSPKVIAELNDYQIKLVKFQGDFVWHSHPDTDEVFLVQSGEMEILFRRDHLSNRQSNRQSDSENQIVKVKSGEMYVIPKGVEHCTRADSECQAMIIEPRGVVNTGGANSELTADNDVWI